MSNFIAIWGWLHGFGFIKYECQSLHQNVYGYPMVLNENRSHVLFSNFAQNIS